MAQKGGRVDASGEKIRSFRIVTDSDADSGIGSFLDPIRTDPVGITVQPVSVVGTVTTTGGAGGGAATIADAADVAQGATTDAAVTPQRLQSLCGCELTTVVLHWLAVPFKW